MPKFITIRDASRAFSRCVRAAEAGETFVITRSGKPVARLLPIGGAHELSPEQTAALARTEARMAKGWPLGAGPIDRETLHER